MSRRTAGWGPAWAWVLLALWVCVIWGHSMVPAQGSDAESLAVVGVVRRLFELLGVTDVHVMNHVVRKAGHFCEYLVLGLLAVNALRPRWEGCRERLVPTLVLGTVVPIVDETIQVFVPGRAGMPADVLLDMSGFAIALAAIIATRGVSPSG